MEWPWWATLIVVLILLEVLVFAFFIRRNMAHRAEITHQENVVRDTGESTTALVLETTDTGKRLGAYLYIVVKLRLQITPSTGSAFETTIEANISPVRLGDFAEGKQIAVRCNPQTRAVVIDQRTR